MKKEGGVVARPSKYDKDLHPLWAWSLALEGLTDKQIAEKFGITEGTINEWKKKYPEFSKSLKEGKEPSDAKVEHSLFMRATGYTYKEKKIIQTIDKDGNAKPARVEVTEKTVLPDTTACIYWLKNRKRDKWKDKQDVEVSNENHDINITVMPATKEDAESDE